MPTNYERVLKEFLPAFKAGAAKAMVREYKLSQQESASILGITQAAISKYLNNSYSAKIKRIESGLDKRMIRRFVEERMNGSRRGAQRIACDMCQLYHEFDCSLRVK
ncbi:MAG: hypothetical protein KGH98_00280 [Candidatus Micrarchaeota archaeon]|nr:hypothetical protein [Candidatus Micrarchaeota archaeon]